MRPRQIRDRRGGVHRADTSIQVPLRSSPGTAPSFPRARIIVTREVEEGDPDASTDSQHDDDDDDEEEHDESVVVPSAAAAAATTAAVSPSSDSSVSEFTLSMLPSPTASEDFREHKAENSSSNSNNNHEASALTILEDMKSRVGVCVVCQELPLESFICPNVHSICTGCYRQLNPKQCPLCRIAQRFTPNYVYQYLVHRFWGRDIKNQHLTQARATTTHGALLQMFKATFDSTAEVFCAEEHIPVARVVMLTFFQEYAATTSTKFAPTSVHMKNKLRSALADDYISILDYPSSQQSLWWVYLCNVCAQDDFLCTCYVMRTLYIISRRKIRD